MAEVGPAPVWSPSEEAVASSQMAAFMAAVNEKHGVALSNYEELWQWSIDNIGDFWGQAWDFLGMKASEPYTAVVDDAKKLPGASWFEGAKLNFAEQLLRFRDEETAFIQLNDCSREATKITYAQLYKEVAVLASALRAYGLKAGDRVAGFMPNIHESMVTMLAVTSIGALWSSCSPDFGSKGVLDRFGQIEPRLVFASDGYFYKGKLINTLAKLSEIVDAIPSVEKVIVWPYTIDSRYAMALPVRDAVHYVDFVAGHEEAEEIDFEQLPFDHPVYIMYSSGTTGLPKCIVQGVGVVLNHLKEHVLHCDLKRGERLFYFSTTGWMMWNWLASALGVGATLVLFDGNPLAPTVDKLWRMAEEHKVNIFGTSAKYLTLMMNSGVVPKRDFDLSALRAILSTGSPATTHTFDYVYGSIKEDVQFASISGGTDLNGCFALGSPMLPVYSPQLQCRGLGMDVAVWDDSGAAVVGEKGELVCLSAFPSMPLYFWNDEDGARYKGAYFAHYDGVWRHGDFAELTPQSGMIIYGRSDATLNPGGVRIGTAEIYRVVEEEVDGVVDSVCIGQPFGDDVRVVLFVKLADGLELTDELRKTLCKNIRFGVSPRHVPAIILACPDVPYTVSGKKVELAVRKAVMGEEVKNKGALKNPDAVDFFYDLPELAA
eukprot:PLAT10333.1.p1 GENE.PLAT10333.1~~PLAT10333.1.p1  ORF type:complete len:659 (+),score=356.27 PLAT10333.1:1-1977(+)